MRHTILSILQFIRVRIIVFNVTFNNISAISWRSVLLVEETGVPGENHRSVASHWQPLSHNVVVHLAMTGFELTTLVVIGTDCRGTCSWKSNYHTITTTTTPGILINLFLTCTYKYLYNVLKKCKRHVHCI
jgi:hypothetical protein